MVFILDGLFLIMPSIVLVMTFSFCLFYSNVFLVNLLIIWHLDTLFVISPLSTCVSGAKFFYGRNFLNALCLCIFPFVKILFEIICFPKFMLNLSLFSLILSGCA